MLTIDPSRKIWGLIVANMHCHLQVNSTLTSVLKTLKMNCQWNIGSRSYLFIDTVWMEWDCSLFGSTASTVPKSLSICPDNLLPYQHCRNVSEQGLKWLKQCWCFQWFHSPTCALVKVPKSCCVEIPKEESTFTWKTAGSCLLKGKVKSAKSWITILSIRTISLSSRKYNEYRLHWMDFRASWMKWDSTLEQKGLGYFPLVWEKRRLCSGSKRSTVCSLQQH